MVIIILIAFVFACISADAIIQYYRKKKSKRFVSVQPDTKTLNENSVMVPKGLYYGKGHMWAFMERNGLVRIGVDDFIMHVTGPINKVKLKNPGDKIQKGQPAVTVIQKGKHLTLNAPVSGTIISQNYALSENSSLLNSSPYSLGWIYTIEPLNWFEDSKLLIMANRYLEWLKDEFTRLKDFLAVITKQLNGKDMPILYQDGGELNRYFLEDMGPQVWEDFQTSFINTCK